MNEHTLDEAVSAAATSQTPSSDTVSSDKDKDQAWASINTPLNEKQLQEFCLDVERIMRINPMIEYQQWRPLGHNRYAVSGRNLSQDPAFDFAFEIEISQTANEVCTKYSSGLKASTTFRINPMAQGAKLTIIDTYHKIPEQDQELRLNEVDKSIINWANDIQVYLVMWQRWSWLPLWRWYMRKIWQPLKPSARRISYMLIWITAAEIAFISLAFLIYWLEH